MTPIGSLAGAGKKPDMTDSKLQATLASLLGNCPTITKSGAFRVVGGDLAMPARCERAAAQLGLDLVINYGVPVFTRRGDKGAR